MTASRAVLLLTLTLLISSSPAEDLLLGSRVNHDRLLQKIQLTSNFYGSGHTSALDTKRVFAGDGRSKITELRVIEQSTGCASAIPINGGPGTVFVVLQVTAPADCRVDYTVELYGIEDIE